MAVHKYSRKKDAVEKHDSLHPEGRWHFLKNGHVKNVDLNKAKFKPKKKNLVKSQNKYTNSNSFT